MDEAEAEAEAVAGVGTLAELDFDRSNTGSPSTRNVLVGKFGLCSILVGLRERPIELACSRALDGPVHKSEGEMGEAASWGWGDGSDCWVGE